LNKTKYFRFGIELNEKEYQMLSKPKWYQFRLKRWNRRMKRDWKDVPEEKQRSFRDAIKLWGMRTPKSKSEKLCNLTRWFFPDGVNLCVDIPSEGIHAFYGDLGFEKAIQEIIDYLEKLKLEMRKNGKT